jgi:hypothetical protein
MSSNLAEHDDDDGRAKAQAQIDEKIKKLVSEYAASEVRSGNENIIRANIRETIEKLGFHPKAFQDEVRTLKTYTPGERADYDRSRQRMRNILEPEQETFFPDHVEAARKREARKREAELKAAQEAEAQGDLERSDPRRGGAAGADGRAPAKDAAPKAKRPEKNVKAPAKTKPKGKGNVVQMRPAAATKKSGDASDAAVREAIARQAQQAGSPGDGSAADIQAQEQEAGDQALKDGLPSTLSPPSPPAAQ